MDRLIDVDKEEWKAIPGYEDCYEISSEGRIKSKMRYVKSGKGLRRAPSQLIGLTVHPDSGHMRAQLSKEGKHHTFLVYNLVMEVHGNQVKPRGYKICHKDEDKTNNSLVNLSWVPDSFRGETHQKSTLNNLDVDEIRALRQSGMTVDQIATKMQISKAQVSKIANYKSR